MQQLRLPSSLEVTCNNCTVHMWWASTDPVIISFVCACDTCTKFDCRLLLSIDRRQSVEEARDTLKMALEYSRAQEPQGRVVGMDLSGDPRVCEWGVQYSTCIKNSCSVMTLKETAGVDWWCTYAHVGWLMQCIRHCCTQHYWVWSGLVSTRESRLLCITCRWADIVLIHYVSV